MKNKTRRLAQKAQFDRVFSSGAAYTHQGLVARCIPSDRPRLGLAIGRHYGSSVKRNRLKRQIRAAFDRCYPSLPAFDMVVSTQPGTGRTTFDDIIQLFGKVG